MVYQQTLFKYFLIFAIFVLVQAARRTNHQRYNHDYPQLPAITFDNLNNCYVESIHLKGQCVRFHECFSAVDAWQRYQRIPYSCYYSAYENFVCCPEAYIKPIFATTLPPPPQYYATPVDQLPARITNQPEERKSEKECSSIYNNAVSNHRRRHHNRSKRNVDVNQTEGEPKTIVDVNRTEAEPKTNVNVNQTEEKDFPELVHEEIKKAQFSTTQAVGGIQTYRNEFPYMCALGWRKSSSKHTDTSYNCGCVLIARKYVLTAAHCATLGGQSPSVVRLGGVDLDERNAEIIKIQRISQHPDYSTHFAYNDIAVVKLERGSRENPACLWPNEGLPQQTLTALGYGQTKFAGPTSNTLLKVFLNVTTNENCNIYYEKEDKLQNGINLGQICAGDSQGIMDTCQGDSGGPMLMKVSKYNTNVPYVVGLTSFGEGCATSVPSVYTRVSYFIDWIEDIVWK